MKQLTKNIALTTLTALIGLFVNAQSGIYVPQGANVFFASNQATAFSSVQNDGTLAVAKHAVVNFEGKTWSNGSTASITGEGVVRFSGKDSAQQIDGGYNAVTRLGAAFANLQIDNKAGVELINSNAKVSNELNLKNGSVTVNENILIVGNNNAGKITGYNAKNYIVTDSKEGYLLREGINKNDGSVVFPVGTVAGYTPATIRSHADATDNFYVNVAEGVVNTDANRTVNRTWNIGKQFRPLQDSVEVALQHLSREEGTIYAQNSKNAFAAQYVRNNWIRTAGSIGLASSFTKMVANTSVTTPNVPTAPTTGYKFNIWPNPAVSMFNVSMDGNVNVESIVIWNIVGVQLFRKATNGENLVQIEGLMPGTYVVGFIGLNGKVLQTRKVVVAGK